MKNQLKGTAAESCENIPLPEGKDRLGTITWATQILRYLNESTIYLFADKKWIAVKNPSAEMQAKLWDASTSLQNQVTIALSYSTEGTADWVQIRTRWATDPKWGV